MRLYGGGGGGQVRICVQSMWQTTCIIRASGGMLPPWEILILDLLLYRCNLVESGTIFAQPFMLLLRLELIYM